MTQRGKHPDSTQEDSRPVSLHVPVIPEPGAAGLAIIESFIADLRTQDSHKTMAGESARLKSYMNALSQRLRDGNEYNAIAEPRWRRGVINYHDLGGWHAAAAIQYTPLSMHTLFNKLARDTGNILLSEVTIISADVLESLKKAHSKEDGELKFFSKQISVSGYAHHMGFVQCPHRRQNTSIALPVMALDQRIMERLSAEDATSLLTPLSRIATLGNHDILHHLTSTQINSNISGRRATPAYADALDLFIKSYLVNNDTHPDSYEAWALLSHARTYRQMDYNDGPHELHKQVDLYYTAIEKFDNELKAKGATDKARRQITNHLSTIGAYIVMRLVPLTDPLMDQTLTRIEKMANPQTALYEFMRDKWKAPFTRYPAHVNLPALQSMYQELISQPDFITAPAQRELLAVLTQNARFELEKPEAGRNKALNGAAALNPEAVMSYAPALTTLRFDEDYLQGPAIRESHRMFMLSEMRQIRQFTVNFMFNTLQSYCHRHILDPETPARLQQLGLLYFDGLRTQAVQTPEKADRDSLAFGAARNYKAAGHDLLGAQGSLPEWRQIKTWNLMRAMPLVSYLGSPDTEDSNLARMRHITDTVDRAVINIVSKPA